MGSLLVAARLLLALLEREAGHRVRRAAGVGALVLAALLIGLAGLLLVLYAAVLALTPYLTPAGAAALIGGIMILLAAIVIAVTFHRPRPPRRVERAAADAATDLGAGIETPPTFTVALAALIAGLVAGRKL